MVVVVMRQRFASQDVCLASFMALGKEAMPMTMGKTQSLLTQASDVSCAKMNSCALGKEAQPWARPNDF